MENKILERGTPEYMEAVERLEELLAKAEVEMGLLNPVPKPQTIYAGTEDNVEFFKQITTAFGIDI